MPSRGIVTLPGIPRFSRYQASVETFRGDDCYNESSCDGFRVNTPPVNRSKEVYDLRTLESNNATDKPFLVRLTGIVPIPERCGRLFEEQMTDISSEMNWP